MGLVDPILSNERERIQGGTPVERFLDLGTYAGLTSPVIAGGFEVYQTALSSAEPRASVLATVAVYGMAYAVGNRALANLSRRMNGNPPYDRGDRE